ncbi:MAG TPA: hypothetical protein VGK61_08430 [Planctomycetota bacterium]|jgi:hypothetical protein
MAILFRGKTQCGLCREIIGNEHSVVCFGPFVGNELDPLLKFSDACFHEKCFQADPLARRVQARWDAHTAAFKKRSCLQCGKVPDSPDNYLIFDYFSDDEKEPAFRLNLLQFHESCLRNWAGLRGAHEILADFKQSGRWKGPSIDYMLEVLQRAQGGK